MDAIATVALFVTSLLPIHLASSTTAAAPPLLPPTSCSSAIILLSPCLPYISSPPNDLDSRVTPYCCRAYSLVLLSGSGICLCYLLREPDMLGFPLNNTRLISLSSDCSLLNVSFVNRGSLESLCSVSPPLPPLSSSNGGSNVQAAPDSSPASSPSPDTSPPPDHAASSGEAPSFAPEAADISPDSLSGEDAVDSSAAQHINTRKRSRLLASTENMLLAIIVGHL